MADDQTFGKLCKKKEQSFNLIGKKWIISIIHTLMEKPKRFSEIHAYIPDLSKKMLNERMKELEDHGIVERDVISERPLRTEYTLTAKGLGLGQALKSIEDWADEWW
ncbi:winged helix-turn-helix transcriptional regulator [Bacillus testis]|uniref:winged helix-turn-helix transcriptional regulator n=1 Tax=Bacillus testis TaxID=1622072 RepID=UPI00067F5A3D|nr:helix-turn-helix domain-containing protein [Bacillus testis]